MTAYQKGALAVCGLALFGTLAWLIYDGEQRRRDARATSERFAEMSQRNFDLQKRALEHQIAEDLGRKIDGD